MKIRLQTWLVLTALVSQGALADDLSDQARGLLENGKATAAYALLEPLEGERAGDVAFDLLLGIAAVEVGQNSRAVFALERVLAQEPNHVRARAEIARAYLALGETGNARQEFATVQRQGVPAEVSATIDRYLAAVERLEGETRTTVRGYVEATLGHDDNVNVAPNRSQVAIPGLGNLPFTLDADSRARDDGFGTLGAGLTLRTPLTRDLAFVGGVSGTFRNNFSGGQFDNSTVDANAGLVLTMDKQVWSLTAQAGDYYLDDRKFRATAGITGQWQYNVDARNQVSAFVQYTDLHYPDQSVRNADRWVGGGAYAHAFRGGEVLFASLYGVEEKETADDLPHLGHAGYGTRVGGQLNLGGRTVLFGHGSVEYRRYGGTDPAFLVRRRDTQLDLSAGIAYSLDRDWKLLPKVSYTKNDSNADLYDYARTMASVTVRRDF